MQRGEAASELPGTDAKSCQLCVSRLSDRAFLWNIPRLQYKIYDILITTSFITIWIEKLRGYSDTLAVYGIYLQPL